MVHCCVPECTNHSKKTASVSYHKIPKDLKLQKTWIARLRRDNLPPLANCYVCSEHFELHCFESDLKEQCTGVRGKRRLKKDAVPSIFNFTTNRATKRRSTEDRVSRKQKKQVLDDLLSPSTSRLQSENEDLATNNIVIDHMPNEEIRSIDIGTQCSFDLCDYEITKTVSTQTTNTTIDNDAPCAPSHMSTSPADPSNEIIQLDHSYSIPQTPTMFPQHSAQSVSPQKSIDSVSPQKSVKSSLFSDDNDTDDDEYVCSTAESQSTDTSTESELEEEIPSSEKYVKMPKYLVFDSCIRELFKFCLECGACVAEMKTSYTGSLLTVKTTCLLNHYVTWNSQPIINKTPVGNLLICSSILFTGNMFTKVQSFASCLGLKFLSAAVYYKHQERYLFPIVNEEWEYESMSVIEDLSKKNIVKLNGDGRCDSPGHNAKYGTYTLMDSDTQKVVIFNVVQVTEVTSSNAMEKEGFVRCLSGLEFEDIAIDTITTDRHTSITSVMEKEYSHIKHQYDVWHLSKSIVKKLNKRAKTKKCEDLCKWIQSVSNHLWWCAATCNGDPVLLEEKWVSILHHIRNKHSWNDATIFKKCSHPRITQREARRKCWLKAGTPAYIALEEVVLHPRIIKDLSKLTDFCHTGSLEVYHSMLLKYCPKRHHFSYKGMVARTQLAAIDNNHNSARNQAVIKSGERAGDLRFNKMFPKMHKRWVVKPVKEKKKYDFLPKLQIKVLEMCDGSGDIPEPLIQVEFPDNIASGVAPEKQELIDRHQSRFSG